jgi:hypothetical protein
MEIYYILWSFGIFFTVLVCFTKKNLATLRGMGSLINFVARSEDDEPDER